MWEMDIKQVKYSILGIDKCDGGQKLKRKIKSIRGGSDNFRVNRKGLTGKIMFEQS